MYTALFVATYYASRNLSKDTAANSAVLALTLGFPNAAAVVFLSSWLFMAHGLPSPSPLPWQLRRDYDHPDYPRDSGKRYRCRSDTFSLSSHPRISVECSKNPVFWAPVLGVILAVVKFHMPVYVEKSLSILGAATEGTALFVTGLIVSAQRFRLNWSVGWGVLAKNVIQPALCFALVSPLAMPLETD